MRFQTRLVSRGAFALGALGVAVALHAGTPPERLFLQQVSPDGAIVKWRGGDAQTICYSTEIANLYKSNWSRCVDGVETEGGHKEARLTSPGIRFHVLLFGRWIRQRIAEIPHAAGIQQAAARWQHAHPDRGRFGHADGSRA